MLMQMAKQCARTKQSEEGTGPSVSEQDRALADLFVVMGLPRHLLSRIVSRCDHSAAHALSHEKSFVPELLELYPPTAQAKTLNLVCNDTKTA